MRSFVALAAALVPCLAAASSLNGAELGVQWALPFAGILLCIAICPLLVPHFWHKHFGKVALFWGLCSAVPLYFHAPADVATTALAHAMIGDYFPFLLFVGALFIVAGGIYIQAGFMGKPIVNAGFLASGAFLANVMGTTGVAMLLVRPLIATNAGRTYSMHTFIFFIFIVANIGGCLTPLGDPPLFLGFLRGVGFFWTAQHLIVPLLTTLAILIGIYLVIDTCFYRLEIKRRYFVPEHHKPQPFAIHGKINFLYLALIVSCVLMSGMWHPGVEFNVLGVHLPLEGVIRDCCFAAIAGLSLLTTPKRAREGNQFSWDPILEVAKLFFGIFLCIVPVLEMLRAGPDGAFAPIVALVTNASGGYDNKMFFWLTGMLSAFLDNAPTYLAFFNLAGGEAASLMTEHAQTLMAVSMGAVFMGAVTYIGNAPNFMTVSIVKERGIKMPSFFGYMLWSVSILFPTFLIVQYIFL
ncbi:MAG: sodium:proton antiporter [Duodenibacillus sp.]|nr:sodium:proton antiporter [Duodenibacillus sp.]